MAHELNNNNEQDLTEAQLAKQQLIAKVGSAFHEQWRETRRIEDGSFEPREKSTSDQAWIEANGTDMVDIANTSYEDLPEDWKGENKAAAEFVVGLREELSEAGVIDDLEDTDVREHIGDEIHNAWLGRNEWAKDGDLGVQFTELPVDEQKKDLDQYRTLLAVIETDKMSVTDFDKENPDSEYYES